MTTEPQQIALLSLLVGAHALGDFVLPARWASERRSMDFRRRTLQALAVGVLQLLILGVCAPTWSAVPILAAGTAGRLGIDELSLRLELRWPRQALSWFALDQALHLLMMGMLCALLAVPENLRHEQLEQVGQIAVIVAAYAFNVHGGSAIVGRVLRGVRPDSPSAAYGGGSGRIIGIEERLLILTLVWLQQWEAIGFVLTAKSVARFKEFDENRDFAETYLVGTLTSTLVAIASGLLLRALIAAA